MWRTDDLAAEERKVATIVFADLVGSTELSGRMDPEALRGVIMRYFQALSTQIERHGGTVEKFIGDAVMAVFGVPTSHEDDARRALAATLDMVEALAAFNAEVEASLGVQLQARIGVNTGEVIATRDRSARQGLVAGEVVNLAARLEQHAGPGEILIGASTLQAAGAVAITGPMRALTVKGKADPIDAHPLLDLLPDDPVRTRRFDLPFVGRARELAALDLAADRIRVDGSASLLTLYGDPGIGKTRLITHWLAERPELLSAAARCPSYADDGSIRPLYDLVALAAATAEADTEAVRGQRDRLVEAIAADRPVIELYGPLAEFVEALAGLRPVCLVLDDLQWASPLLLDVVDRLVEDLADQPILFVCAARPGQLADGRSRLGQGLLNVTSIELSPLSDGDAELVAAGLSEVIAHDPTAVRQLVARAEGNPLHLEQLAAASDEGHRIDEIPPTLRALIAARLDMLAPAERGLLDAAAVVGRDFCVADVAPMLDGGAAADGTQLRPVLRELGRRRLIESHRRTIEEQVTHRFTSAMIHDVVYEAITKTRRAALHCRAADAQEARGPVDGRAASSEETVRRAKAGAHLERAYRCHADLGLVGVDAIELRRRAVAHLVAAGRGALYRVDLPWAGDLLHRAVGLASDGDAGQAEALELHGEVLLATGARADAQQALRDARSRAEQQSATLVAAHAQLLLAQLDPAEGGVAHNARRLLDVFTAHDDHMGLARTRIRLGAALMAEGQCGPALAELDAALSHATHSGSDIERANALGAIGQALWWGPTTVSDAIDRCQALLDEHGRGRSAVIATLGFPLTMLLAASGDGPGATARLDTTARAMAELGYAEAAVFRPLLTGLVAASRADADGAARELRQALSAARRAGSVSLTGYAARELTRCLLAADRDTEVPEVLAAAVQAAPPGPVEAADLAGLRAWWAAVRGEAAESRQHLEAAAASVASCDSLVARAVADLDRAYALRALGAVDQARAAAVSAAASFRHKGHLVGVERAHAFATV